MEAKKVRERFLLDGFATVCMDFPTGIIEGTESPDFLILQGSRVISIEVIDYVRGQDGRGSTHRRNEMALQELAFRASHEYASLCPPPFVVRFLGHPPGQQLPKINTSRLALDAAETVSRFVPETLLEVVRIDRDQFKDSVLQTVVASISATRVRNARQGSWWSVVSADSYVTEEQRERFLQGLLRKTTLVEIEETVRGCRDPKEDKFLELTVNGRADYIVSGDADLLVPNPFRGINVLTPSDFLDAIASSVPETGD